MTLPGYNHSFTIMEDIRMTCITYGVPFGAYIMYCKRKSVVICSEDLAQNDKLNIIKDCITNCLYENRQLLKQILESAIVR